MHIKRRISAVQTAGALPTHGGIRRTVLAWALAAAFVVGGSAPPARAAEPQPALVLSVCHGMASAAPFEQTSNANAAVARDREFVRTISGRMYGAGYESAVQQLDDAIQRDPANGTFYITRGEARYGRHEFSRANEDFSHAIKLDSVSWIAYANRGEAYERMFEHDRAIADLDRALQLFPGNARALTFRGSAYLNKRDYDRAVEYLSAANALDPRCSAVLLARGTAYNLRGDRERAAADNQSAIELNAKWMNIRGFALRASAYGKIGQYDLALQNVQARRRDPRNSSFWSNLCLYQAIAGTFDKALVDCNEALRLQPYEPQALENRGFTYFRMGSLDAAIADYDAALRKEPKLAHALYGRGVAKRLQGDIASSEADMASALAIAANVADEMALNGVK